MSAAASITGRKHSWRFFFCLFFRDQFLAIIFCLFFDIEGFTDFGWLGWEPPKDFFSPYFFSSLLRHHRLTLTQRYSFLALYSRSIAIVTIILTIRSEYWWYCKFTISADTVPSPAPPVWLWVEWVLSGAREGEAVTGDKGGMGGMLGCWILDNGEIINYRRFIWRRRHGNAGSRSFVERHVSTSITGRVMGGVVWRGYSVPLGTLFWGYPW